MYLHPRIKANTLNYEGDIAIWIVGGHNDIQVAALHMLCERNTVS